MRAKARVSEDERAPSAAAPWLLPPCCRLQLAQKERGLTLGVRERERQEPDEVRLDGEREKGGKEGLRSAGRWGSSPLAAGRRRAGPFLGQPARTL